MLRNLKILKVIKILVLSFMLIAALSIGRGLVFAQEGDIESGRYYKLIAKHSGKCLDVSGISKDNGAAIIQWDWLGGDNQQWFIQKLDNGYYKLVAKHSGKCLDVRGISQGNGAVVQQYTWNGGDNQQWFIQRLDNGYYKLVAKHSGKCLDVSGISKDNGAAIIQYDWWGGDNQQWDIVPVADGITSGSYYKLIAKHSGKCLDVSGISKDNGAAIIQWDWWGGDNQQWFIQKLDNGYYKLIAKHSGKCLDVSGISKDNGAAIIQWDWWGGDNQQWFIQKLDNGYYKLVAKHSGKCLDVSGISKDNGAVVQQYTWNGGDNQQWSIDFAVDKNDSIAEIKPGVIDMKGLYTALSAQRNLQNNLLNIILTKEQRNSIYRACPEYKIIPVTIVYLQDDDGKRATGYKDSYGVVHPMQRFYSDTYDYRANMIGLTNDILLASGACFGLELKYTVLLKSTLFNSFSVVDTDNTYAKIVNFLEGDNSVIVNPAPDALNTKNIVIWMPWGKDPKEPDMQGFSGDDMKFIKLPAFPADIYFSSGRLYLGNSHLAHELGHFFHLSHTFPNVALDIENMVYSASWEAGNIGTWEYELPFSYPVQKVTRKINLNLMPKDSSKIETLQTKIKDAINNWSYTFDQDYWDGVQDTKADLLPGFFTAFNIAPYSDSYNSVCLNGKCFELDDSVRLNIMSYWGGNQELKRYSPEQVKKMEDVLSGTRNYLAYKVASSPTIPYKPYSPYLMTQAEWELMVKMYPESAARLIVGMGY